MRKESRMKVDNANELSAKVKSDSIKIDLLEAEVERLKKFEDASGRLRKYVGELSRALIKAQGLDPLIQMPDAGGDSQLFSSESVEEVSQNLQSFGAVVFNEIIMDRVFKNLDVKTIKTCRLVCANWNEKASRILSRRNGGYGLAVCLEELKLRGMSDALGQHTIQGLSSIVASAPQHWFSKALLDNNFTRITEIQSVLLDFGYLLRSIEITGRNFLFQDVYKILVEWCPNLEQLALPPHLIVQDGENAAGSKEPGYQKLAFTRPLKLTGLFMQEELCISIVKASPNLKTLNLTCNSDKNSLQFFKELLNCPEVTRNLENMKLYTGCKETMINEKMELFNSFQFSNKLKKLEIDVIGDFRTKELSEALEKLGGSLEKLVLSLCHHMDPDSQELVFPHMNNLTELRYFNLAATRIGSIEFLTGMPSLKTLYLGEYYFVFPRREYFIDHLFSDCKKLIRSPRKKLKELYLFGVVQSLSHTFQMMDTIFPNLTKLVVGIFVLPNLNDWEELKKYYTALMDGGISKLRNLNDLYLDFRRPKPDVETEFDYIAFIFNQFDKLSSLSDLKCLTVRDNSNSTTELVGDKLLEIPNLQQVTLIGLKVGLTLVKTKLPLTPFELEFYTKNIIYCTFTDPQQKG